MKKVLLVFLMLCLSSFASADMWDTLKKKALDTVDVVGDAVSSGAEAVTDMAVPDRSRQEIDDMAASTLVRLFTENPGA